MMNVAFVSILAALGSGLGADADPDATSLRDGCPSGPALLSLSVDDPQNRCLHPGELLHVTLAMSCVEVPLTGYQAFLGFDTDALTFIEGGYIQPEPFGLPLVNPIVATDGRIDLAAGINPFIGQQPALVDADLVHLVLQANSIVDVTRIYFRLDELETRVTTLAGPLNPATEDSPAVLVHSCDSCLWTDLNCDDAVDLADFAAFSHCMDGPDVMAPDACRSADLNGDTDVDLHDLAVFQRDYPNQ